MTTPTWQPPDTGLPPEPPKRNSHPVLRILGTALLLLVTAGLVANACSSNNTPAPATSQQPLPSLSQAPQPADTQPVDTGPQYSVAQQQAIDSAQSYLDDEGGFSRLGLIDQLHSQAGEGFSKRLAVFAVDHVQVNWKHQAVLSAESYMQSEPGWSFSSLVDQLDSPYGENFTYAQAVYAAHRVGL